jgi:hypothetical protein
MPKSKEKPEIWLLLFKNYKPKEIIAVGYARTTVYNYNNKIHDVIRNYHKASSEIKRRKYS